MIKRLAHSLRTRGNPSQGAIQLTASSICKLILPNSPATVFDTNDLDSGDKVFHMGPNSMQQRIVAQSKTEDWPLLPTKAASNADSNSFNNVCLSTSFLFSCSYNVIHPFPAFSNPKFPPAKDVLPGYDPVMGSTGNEKKGIHRFTSGATPTMQANKISFPIQFVEARGGEYFFVPSMATLTNRVGL